MKYRQLTSSGDSTFCSGATQFLVNSAPTVAQSVLTRLLLLTNEWFLDITAGTPYAQAVVGKYTTGTYDTAIKTRILATQGVISILSYESSLSSDSRSLGVNAKINTLYGEIQINTSLPL